MLKLDKLAAELSRNEMKTLRRKTGTLGKKRMPLSRQRTSFDSVHDPHMFANNEIEHGIVLGTYSPEEWATSTFIRERHRKGLTTTQLDITWIVPAGFGLQKWAEGRFSTYTFFSSNRVLVIMADGILRITSGRGKMEIEVIGDPAWAKSQVESIDTDFRRAASLIEWVYSSRGDEISVPLNFRPAIASAYPWITGSIDDYIASYLDSEASVLILIGPPGTGKSTLIKNIIHNSGCNAKVAYDAKVMGDDGLFASFIEGDSRFLVMEDADAFLQSRDDGNTMMHKFLNVSDGLISSADKKLIFSTNLPNVNDIDPALLRPGRCFDILEFRLLTRDEAQKVVDETGVGTVPDKDKIALAEIFSQQPSAGSRKKRGIGFMS